MTINHNGINIGSVIKIIEDPQNTTIYHNNIHWSILYLKGEVIDIIYPQNDVKIKIEFSFLNNPIITIPIDTVELNN
tara:strand:+ start:35 stop:265 length:231 start_codon:yes stop_codon:yes gene_type:complete